MSYCVFFTNYLPDTKVPTKHTGGGERMVPHLFVKPGADAAATMNFLLTPMTTSAVFKKFDQEVEAAEDGKAEENTKTKKKKAKGKAVESQGSEGQIPWSNLAFPNLEGDVRPSRGVPGVPSADVGRPKHALDDFMHIFFEIVGVAKEKLPENQKAVQSFQASTVSLFRHAISCFYEFVFSGSAAVNGKFCRNYSMFRPELQAFMKSAVDMALSNASVGLGPAGSTTSDKTIPLFADFNLDAGLQIGHLRDESDEVRALQRLKQGVPLCRESGMANFVATILELPVDSNANFITATRLMSLRLDG